MNIQEIDATIERKIMSDDFNPVNVERIRSAFENISNNKWEAGDAALEEVPAGSQGGNTTDGSIATCVAMLAAEADVPFENLQSYRQVSASWDPSERMSGVNWSIHRLLMGHADPINVVSLVKANNGGRCTYRLVEDHLNNQPTDRPVNPSPRPAPGRGSGRTQNPQPQSQQPTNTVIPGPTSFMTGTRPCTDCMVEQIEILEHDDPSHMTAPDLELSIRALEIVASRLEEQISRFTLALMEKGIEPNESHDQSQDDLSL